MQNMKCLLLHVVLLVIFFSQNAAAVKLFENIALHPVKGNVIYSFDEKNFSQLERSTVTDRRILIESREGSFAWIKFRDKSEIRLCPETAIIIDENEVFVLFGNVFFRVGRETSARMTVRTSTAVANPRGTEFEVQVRDQVSEFYVFEGLLDVRSRNFRHVMMLQDGKCISVRKGIFTSRAKPFDPNRRTKFIWDTLAWNKMLENYTPEKKAVDEIISKVKDSGVDNLRNPVTIRFKTHDEVSSSRPQDNIKRFYESDFEKRSSWMMKKVGDKYGAFLGPEQSGIVNSTIDREGGGKYNNRFDSNPGINPQEIQKNRNQIENYRNTINNYWVGNGVITPGQK